VCSSDLVLQSKQELPKPLEEKKETPKNVTTALIEAEPVQSISPAESPVVAPAAPPEPHKPPIIHSHEKDIRKDWLEFIGYVKERKVWMAQDLQRADNIKTENNELRLTYNDPANCTLLRQKENREDLATFAADFFQKTIKIVFVVPSAEEMADTQGADSIYQKRQQLANDPLVVIATEIFTGEVGDIRIGPKWR
jgi:DNA polymerase-3 subunit gamma/tau